MIKFVMNKILLVVFLGVISSVTFSKETVSIVFSERVKAMAQFYLDEIEVIYKKAGIEPIVRTFPEPRALHFFNNSKADALGVKIEEFESHNPNAIKIDAPILKNIKFRAYVLKKDFNRVKTLKKPHVITSVQCLGCKGYSKVNNLKISSYFKRVDTGIKLLQKKRADILIASEVSMKAYSKGLLVPLNKKVYKSDLYHFISKRKSHLKAILEKEFKAAISRNVFDLKRMKIQK